MADDPAELAERRARLRKEMHQASLRALAPEIEAARARLTERKRLAIASRFEAGLSYEEIAKVLGEPSADAARIAVLRALNNLAKAIEP
jgi:DNA-directed RNA polymerase specialized sigma24 family protein